MYIVGITSGRRDCSHSKAKEASLIGKRIINISLYTCGIVEYISPCLFHSSSSVCSDGIGLYLSNLNLRYVDIGSM